MSFPDLPSLEDAARVWKFRNRAELETEAEYRTALADFVQPKDLIESMEIRTSKGWNEFSKDEELEVLRRASQRED